MHKDLLKNLKSYALRGRDTNYATLTTDFNFLVREYSILIKMHREIGEAVALVEEVEDLKLFLCKLATGVELTKHLQVEEMVLSREGVMLTATK